MKKALTIVLVVVLVLSIGITAYATSTDTDANEVIKEVAGRFGFKDRGEKLPVNKELMDELKDLTSEERLALLDSKLEAEEITQEAYGRLKVMIENGFTFEPKVHNQNGKQGFSGRGFTKELMDELKDLTSEERLALLDNKLEAEEITQEAYDRLKIMIEDGCTFEPPMHGRGSEKLFDRELMDEFKDLTSEEQLALLNSKLEAEEITQEAYDKLKVMIEDGCTFEPPVKSNNENGKGPGRIKPALEQNTESI